MTSLRYENVEKRYRDLVAQGHLKNGCIICRAQPIQQFTYWKIIPNDFPYERIAKVHHMIVPLRHIVESELTPEELRELRELKNNSLDADYNYLMEATHKNKSIPEHHHIHLVKLKEILR